ncbi:hypothetical protein M948_11370 [Virgibacillus sp. CM-4]|uniref:DUF3231 family protein n=1 Tax=Virgibacillus sp. CM-4 TaxID=1354277 RepID=UPI0003887A27|nr:DUF3231 family protein [Virgibacillus sp. CM-4]EQB37018.1 hypothetical protein M948_11370 [Virgibacillus sp. CM-4]
MSNNFSAADISPLWTSYQYDTVSKCGLHFFLNHVDDPDIKQILEQTLALVEEHIEHIKELFHRANHPLPHAFTTEDVNVQAPRLFSDQLYLKYVYNMTDFMMNSYGLGLTVSDREDVISYYSTNIEAANKLNKQAKKLEKQKGLYIGSPQIPKQTKIEFVNKQNFINGWIGERRPLLGVEITNLVFHAKRNAIGHALITGFSQVAASKEVRKFFERGRDISGKHFEIFTSILHEEFLSESALLLTSEVTDSTVAPFSDRLMMTFVSNLIASSMGQYGVALSSSPRHDLSVHYSRLIAEVGKYANEGNKILIKNGWLEQPPMAADRRDLAK